MQYKKFEDYLMQVFHEDDGKMVLDDDLPEAFDEWVSSMDIELTLLYADSYAKIKSIEAIKRVGEQLGVK